MASRIEDLLVWQDSMDLVDVIYRVTAEFPREEQFGLTSQLRRAAASVPSNIAEGQGRRGRKEGLHFLGIGRGSLQELRTQIYMARRLGFLSEVATDEILQHADRVGRRLTALMQALARKEPPHS